MFFNKCCSCERTALQLLAVLGFRTCVEYEQGAVELQVQPNSSANTHTFNQQQCEPTRLQPPPLLHSLSITLMYLPPTPLSPSLSNSAITTLTPLLSFKRLSVLNWTTYTKNRSDLFLFSLISFSWLLLSCHTGGRGWLFFWWNGRECFLIPHNTKCTSVYKLIIGSTAMELKSVHYSFCCIINLKHMLV